MARAPFAMLVVSSFILMTLFPVFATQSSVGGDERPDGPISIADKASGRAAEPWYNMNWKFRRDINISNPNMTGDLSQVQVSFNISYYSGMKGEFSDLRFTQFINPNLYVLAYYIEDYSITSYVLVHVRVFSLPKAATTTIHMYYGNQAAQNASDGNATFEFFDDFGEGILNTTKWAPNHMNIITYSIAQNALKITDSTKTMVDMHWIADTTDSGSQHMMKWTPTSSFIVEWSQEVKQSSAAQAGQCGVAIVGSDDLVNGYLYMYDDNNGSQVNYVSALVESTHINNAKVPNYSTDFKIEVDGLAVSMFYKNSPSSQTQIASKLSITQITQLSVATGAYNGQPYLDYCKISSLRIRKYVDQVPTNIVGPEERSFSLRSLATNPTLVIEKTMTDITAIIENPSSYLVPFTYSMSLNNTTHGPQFVLCAGSVNIDALSNASITCNWDSIGGIWQLVFYQDYTPVTDLTIDVDFRPLIFPVYYKNATEDVMFSSRLEAWDKDLGNDVLNWSVNDPRFNITALGQNASTLTFLPTNDDVGSFRVNVSVRDRFNATDHMNFTMDVMNVNDPPVINTTDVKVAFEDQLYWVRYNATDVDLNTMLEWTMVTNAGPWLWFMQSNQQVLMGTPTQQDIGECWVNITVKDGDGGLDSHNFTLTVIGVNEPPLITSKPPTKAMARFNYIYQVVAEDEDPGDGLEFLLLQGPGDMTMGISTGLISWYPTEKQVGDHSVVIQVTDGELSGWQNFTINVEKLEKYPPRTTLEYPVHNAISYVSNPALVWTVEDPDSPYVTYDVYLGTDEHSVSGFNPGVKVAKRHTATVFVPSDELTAGRYYWTVVPSDETGPGTCANGTWSFTVDDNSTEDMRSVVSLISPFDGIVLNTSPVTLKWSAAFPGGNVEDLTYYVFFNPDRAKVVVHDYAVAITSSQYDNEQVSAGVYYWTVIARNGTNFGYCANGVRELTIVEPIKVNNYPVISSAPKENATIGKEYIYNIKAEDKDGDRLSYTLLIAPEGAVLTDAPTIRWTPPGKMMARFELQVSDGQLFVIQPWNVIVNETPLPPNRPPVVEPFKTKTIQVGDTFTYTPKVTDPEGDKLRYELAPSPVAPVGMKLDSANGTVTWTPGPSDLGDHKVLLKIDDGTNVVYHTFNITVTEKPPENGPNNYLKLSDNLVYVIIAVVVGATVLAGFVVYRNREAQKETARLRARHQLQQQQQHQQPMAAHMGRAAAPAAMAMAPRPRPVIPVDEESEVDAFEITDILLIYNDGRLVAHSKLREEGKTDKQIMSSMLIAIQSFVKDSFEEGLTSFECENKKINMVAGNYLILVAVLDGPEPKTLREEMTTVLSKIEGLYAGVVEKWDGNADHFKDVKQYMVPLFQFSRTLKIKRKKEAVKMKSGVEFYSGYVRVKVGVSNDTNARIGNLSLGLGYDMNTLKLSHIQPEYPKSDNIIFLPDIEPGEKRTVAVYFDPIICQESHIDGWVNYNDSSGVPGQAMMKRRPVDIVCPIFYTKENVNVAMLKRLLGELDYNDSRLFGFTDITKMREVYDIAVSTVKAHHVKFVREFMERDPAVAESWFYGEVRESDERLVIKVAMNEAGLFLELFVASSNMSSMTGLLAELASELTKGTEPLHIPEDGMKIRMDAELKNELRRTKMLLEKYADTEMQAGETDQ